MVQNSFLRKFPAIRHMSCWQKLKQLKLYSQERHRERYTIIYIWRMLEGQVPYINSLDGGAKVKSIWHIRCGRECKIPCINHHSPRNIQALKHATLPVRGQQLFNTLLLLHLFPLLCGVDVSCETPPSRPVLRVLLRQPPLRQVVPDVIHPPPPF